MDIMAKYEITYVCGHTSTKQLYGPCKDRESYIEWAKNNALCYDCYKIEKDKWREKENQKAAQANSEAGLPDLQGSPKQIAWAEAIRREVLESPGNTIRNDIADLINQAPANKRPAMQYTYDAMQEAQHFLESQTSAAWWIDHRQGNSPVDRIPIEMYCRAKGIEAQEQFEQQNTKVNP